MNDSAVANQLKELTKSIKEQTNVLKAICKELTQKDPAGDVTKEETESGRSE